MIAEQFRAAMRHLAATVTILTTEYGGDRYGMTAAAVTSVSLDPPSILVAVNQKTHFHPQVSRRGAFCVNLLSANHADECRAFAGGVPAETRFREQCWGVGPDLLPYFLDAEASIFCDFKQTVDWATHTIFIARVTHVVSRETIDPIIYLNGGFVEHPTSDGSSQTKDSSDVSYFDIGFG